MLRILIGNTAVRLTGQMGESDELKRSLKPPNFYRSEPAEKGAPDPNK